MVKAYWQIGKIINEAQVGNKRAEYGKELINELSKKLITDYGKGFDKSNLSRMRKFYSLFNNVDALRQELSWTHYILEESKQIFASKYMLYMPTEEELKREINKDREIFEVERGILDN